MTKVMKLRVTFDGNYGGSVDETTILPMDINGALFDKQVEGSYHDAIGLGEIEGKHSYAEGDLHVEFVNLDKLPIKEAAKLIEESWFGYIEGYFEQTEDDFIGNEEYSEEKESEIRKVYGINEDVSWGLVDKIHDKFIEQLKEKYVHSFKDITVLEEDYPKAVELMKNSNISVH